MRCVACGRGLVDVSYGASGPRSAGGSFLRPLLFLPRVRHCLGAPLLFLLRFSRLLRGSIVFVVSVAVVVVAMFL